VVEWQTRQFEGLVPVRACRFKSCLQHCLKGKGLRRNPPPCPSRVSGPLAKFWQSCLPRIRVTLRGHTTGLCKATPSSASAATSLHASSAARHRVDARAAGGAHRSARLSQWDAHAVTLRGVTPDSSDSTFSRSNSSAACHRCSESCSDAGDGASCVSRTCCPPGGAAPFSRVTTLAWVVSRIPTPDVVFSEFTVSRKASRTRSHLVSRRGCRFSFLRAGDE
jgi:hypothetical protein